MIQFSREKVLLLHKLIAEETGGVFSRQRLMMVSGTASPTPLKTRWCEQAKLSR